MSQSHVQRESRNNILSRLVWIVPIVAILIAAGNLFITEVRAQANACGAPIHLVRGWATDFCQTSVPWSSIIRGQSKDGIPSVTNPYMETIADASEWLGERAPVIVVTNDDQTQAKAYPLAILMWHEIANDVLDGTPIAVTYCPLCNSAIVFDRRVDGDLLELGVSGYLRFSDMIMYDRETESWWQQFTGVGIVGEYNEVELDIIASQVVGFAQFAERYPDGYVMSRDTGHFRSYGTNPYRSYLDRGPFPNFYQQAVDDRSPNSTQHVLGGVVNDLAVAYPFPILSQEIVINDTIGETPVLALWQPGVASALDLSDIDSSRDIGTASLYVRQLDGRELTFYIASDGNIRDNETDSAWNLYGEAIGGELEGQSLERQAFAPHLRFAWSAFQPESRIYGE